MLRFRYVWLIFSVYYHHQDFCNRRSSFIKAITFNNLVSLLCLAKSLLYLDRYSFIFPTVNLRANNFGDRANTKCNVLAMEIKTNTAIYCPAFSIKV